MAKLYRRYLDDTFKDKAFQSHDHNTGGDHTCPVYCKVIDKTLMYTFILVLILFKIIPMSMDKISNVHFIFLDPKTYFMITTIYVL